MNTVETYRRLERLEAERMTIATTRGATRLFLLFFSKHIYLSDDWHDTCRVQS